MNLHLDADRFAIVERGWLIVEGECCEAACANRGCLCPPADLSALVGAKCEACDGNPFASASSDDPCPACLGTGAALLDVTTDCECTLPCPCGCDGTRSLRVRLTGDAVPVWDDRHDCEDGTHIVVHRSGAVELCPGTGDRGPDIDLGPDPAKYVGWFAHPVEVKS